MTRRDRTSRLFDCVVRLRRAQREAPGNEDLLTVRAVLEEELGSSVSRAEAARLLGVSHTALQRWERSGDFPLVLAPNGRTEVPVKALIRIHEAVEDERRTGRRRRHALEPVMEEGRRRAEEIDVARLLPATSLRRDDRHELARVRSLVYHRVLAERLRQPMIDEARGVLWEWRRGAKIDPAYAERWEAVLARPVADVRRVLSADDADASDLRQNSPFAGMLSEPERRKILAEVR